VDVHSYICQINLLLICILGHHHILHFLIKTIVRFNRKIQKRARDDRSFQSDQKHEKSPPYNFDKSRKISKLTTYFWTNFEQPPPPIPNRPNRSDCLATSLAVSYKKWQFSHWSQICEFLSRYSLFVVSKVWFCYHFEGPNFSQWWQTKIRIFEADDKIVTFCNFEHH
jgi:hypothetical protein